MGRVIEIGAVKFDQSGRTIDTFQELINPGVPIPVETTAVHGITDADVREAPSIDHVLQKFFLFIGDKDNVLIAHNAQFDAGFLGEEMERTSLPKPENMILDTLSISRRILRGFESHSLGFLAREFEVDARGHHRALADSIIVKEVFLRLVDRLEGVGSFEDLLQYTPAYQFVGSSIAPREMLRGSQFFRKAIHNGTPILMVYRGGSRRGIPRLITPLGKFEAAGHEYIRAYCHIDGEEKSFRVDRIESFAPPDAEE